jgi:hypothetical protein
VRANQSSGGLSESFESSKMFLKLAGSLGGQTEVSPNNKLEILISSNNINNKLLKWGYPGDTKC